MSLVLFDLRTESKPAALPFRKGDTVRLPAGTEVRSTHPVKKIYKISRAQNVVIHHTLPGRFVSVREALDEFQDKLTRGSDLAQLKLWRDENAAEYYHVIVQVDEAAICWAGTGGYWCEVPISMIPSGND